MTGKRTIAHKRVVRPAGSAKAGLGAVEWWALQRIWERGACIPDLSASYAAKRSRISSASGAVTAAFQALEELGLIERRGEGYRLTENGLCKATEPYEPSFVHRMPEEAVLWRAGRWLLRRLLVCGFCVAGRETFEAVARAGAARDDLEGAEALTYLWRRRWVTRQSTVCILTGQVFRASHVFRLTDRGMRVAQWAQARVKIFGDPPVSVPSFQLPRVLHEKPWRWICRFGNDVE